MRLSASAFALVVALSSSPSRAGYLIEQEFVLPNPVTQAPMKSVMRQWREGKRLKQDAPERNETVVIDLEKHAVAGFSDRNKTYWTMPLEKYQRLALFGFLFAFGMQPGPDGKIHVPDPLFSRSGETATIEGRKAWEARVQIAPSPQLAAQGISMSTSVWMSEDVPLTVDDRIAEMQLSLGDPKGEPWPAIFAQWRTLSGYPVQVTTTVKTPRGSVTTSQTLLSVREMKVPASEFAIPKGYALVDDPLTMAERMARQQMQGPQGVGSPLRVPSSTQHNPLAPGALPPPDAH